MPELKLTRKVGGWRRLVVAAALWPLARSFRTYQPVLLGSRTVSKGKRDCETRLSAILEVFDTEGVVTVIDHGSAEGYFVRRFAEAGHVSFGVEADVRRLLVAQLSLTADGVEGFGFVRADLTAESIRRLPSVDATVSLSVLHHFLYDHGEAYTVEVLEAIRERTNKVGIFEIGQSDETEFSWAKHLPDMGADPHAWIVGLLERAGWSNVTKLCETESWGSAARRATFSAVP